MNIKQILELDVGLAGISVAGRLKVVMPERKHTGQYGEFTTQFVVIEDETGSLPVKVYEKILPQESKGKVVKVTSAKITSYTNKNNELVKQLDVGKKSGIEVVEETDVKEAKEEGDKTMSGVKELPKKKTFEATCVEAFAEVEAALCCEEGKAMLKACTDAGWSSEDTRAMFISRLIEHSRR